MKISSASKKVLASALSAAMVVAFAPTVAFGAANEAIDVTIDLNNGATADSTAYPYAKQGQEITLPSATFAGIDATWQVSTDGGITFTDVNDSNAAAGYQVTLPDTSDKVTYKAVYDSVNFYNGGMTFDETYHNIYMHIQDRSKTKKGVTYSLTVTSPNGVVLLSQTDTAADDGARVLDPEGNVGGQLSVEVSDDFLVAGTYTAVITADGAEVDKVTMNIVKLTYKDGSNSTSVYYNADDSAQCATVAGAITGSWLKGGYAFNISAASLAALSGEVTITKATSKDLSITVGGYGESARTLTYTLPAATLAEGDVYAYEIKDPSGAVIYSGSVTGAKTGTSVSSETLTVTFDQTANEKRVYADATEAAGDYVLSVSVTEKGAEEASKSGKAKITLTEVKYSAGDNGKLKGVLKDASDIFTDSITSSLVPSGSGNVEVSDGYTFDSWDLNGNGAYNNTNNKNVILAGKVNTFTATYKAIDYSKYVATPALIDATYDANKKSWTVKLSCETSGAKIVYGTSTGSYNKTYDAAKGIEGAAETIYVQAQTVNGQTDPALTQNSLELVITRSTAAWTNLVNGTNAVNLNEGKTGAKWAEAADVKAAIEAGNADAEAAGYKTAEDMDAMITADAKALYEAVLAEAEAQLAAYADNAPVIVGEKVYTITEKALETADKAITKAEETLAKAKNAGTSDYKTAIASVISAANTALNGAEESKTYAKADIEAAQAATEALKAATTGEAAEAALAAYEALTDAQKALVATADVVAAQEVKAAADKAAAEEEAKKAAEEAAKEAAAALAAQQDQAAVNYVNSTKSKTVKLGKAAKTKKAATITWKSKVSASGNVVTYAKVSGSAKIKVAAAGTATLKKGVKAGTYTAKVKVTCGSAERTVKVKFVVK